MPKRARNNNPSKQKSFADAVGGVKTASVFAKTTCNLKPPPMYPTRRIPKTKHQFSFFLDLKSTDATDAEVLDVVDKQMNKIKGMHYRFDLSVVELIFANEIDRDANVREYAIPNKKPLCPVAPRHMAPQVVYIRMANLPFVPTEQETRTAIDNHWSTFGKVLGLEPHKIQGKWNTHRWDLLLEVEKGSVLEAPVAFEILGSPVVAAWPSSPPSCLICLSAGHQAKKCQAKKPKLGDSVDPEKISADPPKATQASKKVSDATHGTTASSSGTSNIQSVETHAMDEDQPPTTIAYVAPASEAEISTTSAGIFNVESVQTSESTVGSYTVDSVHQIGAGSSSSGRSTTPPSTLNRPASPDTPRSHAGKRQATGPPSKVTLNDLVYATIKVQKLCIKCGEKDHGKGVTCPAPLSALDVHTKITQRHSLGSFLGKSNKQQKIMKEARKIAAARTEFEIPIASVVCANCENEGHMAFECPHPDTPKGPPCRHCSKKGHVAFHCPDREPYPFEKKDPKLLSEEELTTLDQLLQID
jgi:hypothetical protein